MGNGWPGSGEVDNADASNMKNHVTILLSAMSLAVPLSAAPQPTRSDPVATSQPELAPVATSELNYQSAFADYKPYRDIKPGDWRAANDAVGKASGGHSGQGMGMNSQPVSAAPSNAHSGHHLGGTQK
jgi:hypothetical protein